MRENRAREAGESDEVGSDPQRDCIEDDRVNVGVGYVVVEQRSIAALVFVIVEVGGASRGDVLA